METVVSEVYKVEVQDFNLLLDKIDVIITTQEKIYYYELLMFFIIAVFCGFVLGYIISKKR